MSMNKEKKVELKIQLEEEVAQGTYTNLVFVNHNETEFTLDFIYVQPQQPKAKVHSRVISSPKHTKRLMLALQENMRRWEERFGEVDVSGIDPSGHVLQ